MYEVIIGLEIHAELLTDSKIWCGCSTRFGADANTQVCPICLGLPGTLPVLNERALELAVKAGLALGCEINRFSKFDRKNYFYPDLPKAYQISQYDLPLCRNGAVEFEANGEIRRVRINRVHLEEEAGKSVHSGDNIMGSEYSLIDYNRGGVPLIEIVTEPDLRSPEEARLFMEKLRTILLYAGVSDCRMEEGSLRVDANISLRPFGETELRERAEVKNLNSFRALQRALEYEVRRQSAILDAGQRVEQDTRHWNDQKGVTISMRSKEDAEDYRYFPDPDLVPVVLTEEQIETWRRELPELPDQKAARFISQYGLPAYDARVLTSSKAMADFFEAAVERFGEPKTVSNWVMVEVQRLVNEAGIEFDALPIGPGDLAGLLELVKRGTISNNVGKEVLEEMFKTGKSAADIVKERGLEQISDTGELEAIVEQVIAENPGPVQDVRDGKEKAIGFLVGQVMKLTKGKANPKMVNELLRQKLTGGA
ncbi:MAG: Asp-tRNA(Asn)/Glu-tRNA(Gln) amidotransferase subunit GatB [Clostridia bacterium]|nr:Asp-tRNA(Asn)/Glu-tRNA(Gln) amidotransferase GatCAB subunit B [Bacillota bacterium]MBO2522161.1 Asp-tRNA(Asn)/Glu-tRNA(Gln) amidotransferase GatCAB subunit B [Bacillota bacterium]